MEVKHQNLQLTCWLMTLGFLVGALLYINQKVFAMPFADLDEWPEWASKTEGITIVFSFLSLLTLAVSFYLLAITSLLLAVSAFRSWFLKQCFYAVTTSSVRRLIARIAGTTLVGFMALPVDSISAKQQSEPPVLRHLVTTGNNPVTYPPTQTEPTPKPITQHTVAPGENFWLIAHDTFVLQNSRAPSEKELAKYWLDLVEFNRDQLVDSNNPDLLFPGQTIKIRSNV